MRTVWYRVFGALALAALAGAGTAQAQQPSGVVDGETIASPDLVKAACAEGRVTYYTAQAEADEREIIKPFEKDFPCVHVSVISMVTGRLYERVRTEAEAKVTAADLMASSSETLAEKLIEAKLVRPWTPPSADKFPEGARHQGYWYSANIAVMVPFYNTQMVQGADIPKTWQDLLDPKWKGKIGTSPITIGGSAWAMYAFMKEQLGADYLKTFAAQKPRMFTSFDPVVLAVARGELSIGVVSNGNQYSARQKGAPIHTFYPPKGEGYLNLALFQVANAPHPHAGELFGNWYLSHQGQSSVVAVRGLYSVRPDVGPAPGSPPLNELHIWRVPLERMMQENDAFVTEVTGLFGGR
jgi:iron(III) transport system substrate-binding protein